MSTLKYVGRAPASDSALVAKGFADARHVALDQSVIDSELALVTPSLVMPTYVNTRDNLRAKKTDVDAGDATKILLTQKGVANGVATTGADNYVPSDQLGPVLSDRVPVIPPAPTVYLSSHTVISATNQKEYLAAQTTVADPGWPWFPIIFLSITGYVPSGTVNGSRRKGMGNYGKMVVLDSTDRVWASGITNANLDFETAHAWPAAAVAANPSNTAPLTGGTVLSLYLSLWSGSLGYAFTSANFAFETVVAPA